MDDTVQSEGNADQIEFWNGWMGARWVEQQVFMDRLLEPLGDALLQAAAVGSGQRVLDVGCGCGGTTLAVARAGAQATGIDVSAPMLAHARTRAGGADNPTFIEADAALHPFAGDYDLVLSRFGVMFFNDPVVAFTNLRTALRPGGRLCVLCWRAPQENPWVAVPMAAAQPFLPPTEPLDPRAPGPFAFADSEYVTTILRDAGFADVEVTALDRPLVLGADAEAATEFIARIGPVSRTLADLDEDERRPILDAVAGALAPHAGADGVALGAACWIVTARR
jgi:SAM-dependent methyltransferase